MKKISRYAFEKEILHNEKQVLADLRICSHVVQLQDSNDVVIDSHSLGSEDRFFICLNFNRRMAYDLLSRSKQWAQNYLMH